MDEKQKELIKKTHDLLMSKLEVKGLSKEDKDEAIQIVKDAENTLILATDSSCIILGNTCLMMSVLGALLQNLYADESIDNEMIDDIIDKAKFFSRMSEEELKERFMTSVGDIIETFEEEENEKKEKEEKLQSMIDKLEGLKDS